MPSRNRRIWVLALPVLLLAACNDDDEGNGGGGGPPLQNEFVTVLDTTQEVPAPITGTRVRVTVTNRAPDMGTFQSPVWMGFHDGGFDIYDPGAPASMFFPASNALEHLAEDGETDPIGDEFTTQAFGTTQGVLSGELGTAVGPLAPGETVTEIFQIDPAATTSRFFSYATQILPSNDTFLANGDPQAHAVFDVGGSFVALDFVVAGTAALDAGTETNDELPANTNFFGQTTPDTGTPEAGNVAAHPGYLPAGSGGILDDPMFASADFTAAGYEFLSFTFDELPAAAAAIGLATVTLSAGDAQVDFTVTASGLSGDATAIHFHMEDPGMAGPIVLDLTDTIVLNSDGNFRAEGSLPTPAGFAEDLRDGLIYLNIHTELNPTGEIRGQILTDEAFFAELDPVQEVPAPVTGTDVRVTVTNNAPDLGTFQTPVWIGFHDGGFDTHDLGSPASTFFPVTNALERLAEDGETEPITMDFTTQAFGAVQGTLGGILGPEEGPIAPGETVSRLFRLDPLATDSRFLTYATMIIPSNDAFLSNGDPVAHAVFDAGGSFVATDFIVPGTAALDAGTEVNDEVPANTAFFGQTTPDTGTPEAGNVAAHPGFLPPGSGGILDDPMFASADFTAAGYEFLSVTLDEVAPGDPPSGVVITTLDDLETQIDFQVFASGLSGPATAMHFHEAAPGVPGPIVLDLSDTFLINEDGVLTAEGSKAVPLGFVEALRDGDIYLNIHTALNPSGEIRGQVSVAE